MRKAGAWGYFYFVVHQDTSFVQCEFNNELSKIQDEWEENL
jgi:hypothetical protein